MDFYALATKFMYIYAYIDMYVKMCGRDSIVYEMNRQCRDDTQVVCVCDSRIYEKLHFYSNFCFLTPNFFSPLNGYGISFRSFRCGLLEMPDEWNGTYRINLDFFHLYGAKSVLMAFILSSKCIFYSCVCK